MKTILLILTFATGFWFCNAKAERHTDVSNNLIVNGRDSVDFRSAIQPILQKSCSPCHFTGGKMFDKMPFDQPATLLSHKEGILKRFKDKKEEAEMLSQFIREHKAGE